MDSANLGNEDPDMNRHNPFLKPARSATTLVLLLLSLTTPLAALAAASQVMVTVKETSIRADPTFYAKVITTARYTDQLRVIDEQQGWLRVRFGRKLGWVHSSAVSGTSPGGSGDSAMAGLGSALAALSGKSNRQGSGRQFSEQDVALAGKGFNTKVEGEYRRQNPGANFSAVDKMEKQTTSPKTIMRFADAGDLQPQRSSGASSAKSSKKSADGSLLGGFFGGSKSSNDDNSSYDPMSVD